MWPIVSACGTATYQLVKFLTKILQKYTGIALFVKDSKGFSQNLRSVHLGQDEELVSFDMSALFTSINWLFTEDIEGPEVKGKYSCTFEENTVGLKKNEVMNLLKLVLGNCIFLFQGNFFKQLYGAVIGSPCSPVVANIYMEYIEDLALGPELPIQVKEWKGYVDDIFSIIPKGKRDTMLISIP